jgi:O-antigen/teichoic acid export membrane protein
MSDAPDTTIPRDELRRATLASVRWVTVVRVAAESIGLASTVVLARLLTPGEFGRAALTLILFEIAYSLANEGFGTPLVQRASIGPGHVRTALTLALGLGAVLSVAAALLTAVVVPPIFGAGAVGLFLLSAPVFVIAGPGAVAQSVLARQMDFRRLGVIEVLALVLNIGATIGLALAGLGAAALVLGRLLQALVTVAGQVRVARLPLPGWDRTTAREIGSFGTTSAGAGLLWALTRNIDYTIVGAKLGAVQAGFYWRAFNLAVEYQGRITAIMQRVALPIYSRAENLEDMRALRFRVVRAHSAAIIPLLGLVAAIAPTLVPWLYGPAWEPAVLPTQILAIAGVTYPISAGLGALILAAGLPGTLMAANLVQFAVYVVMLLALAPHGLVAVCGGVAVVAYAQALAVHWFVLDRRVGIPIADVWRDVRPALASTTALVAAATAVRIALDDAGAGPAIVVLAAVAAGGLAYLGVLRGAFAGAWADLVLLARAVLARTSRGVGRRMTRDPEVVRP